MVKLNSFAWAIQVELISEKGDVINAIANNDKDINNQEELNSAANIIFEYYDNNDYTVAGMKYIASHFYVKYINSKRFLYNDYDNVKNMILELNKSNQQNLA